MAKRKLFSNCCAAVKENEKKLAKMSDLIDKQSVLEIAMCYCPDDDGSCSKAGNDLREMLDEIEALPTIEPDAYKPPEKE